MRVKFKDIAIAGVFFGLGVLFELLWRRYNVTVTPTCEAKHGEGLPANVKYEVQVPSSTCACPSEHELKDCNKFNWVNVYKNSSYDRGKNADMSKDVEHFTSKVSILLHVASQQSYTSKLLFLLKSYAGTEILVTSESAIKTDTNIVYLGKHREKADAINAMVKRATKEYLLYLDTDHHIEGPGTDQSVGWLLHFMEQVPIADIIGGSVLLKYPSKPHQDFLEVPCYRIRHKNWTYTETYEYKQSVGDAMACDRTSTSFLARTTTLKDKIQFDAGIGEMLFEDFFLRAKEKGINVLTKPEVMFHKKSGGTSDSRQHVRTSFSSDAVRFGLKHRVYRLVDAHSTIFDLCSRYQLGKGESANERSMCDYEKFMDYWHIKHWSNAGTFAPTPVIVALETNLKRVGKFFDDKGITYWIEGGVALGAVKMRGVLPWDSGDIDIMVAYDLHDIVNLLRSEFVKLYPVYKIYADSTMCSVQLKHGFEGPTTIFPQGRDKAPDKIIRIETNLFPMPVSKKVFHEFRGFYSDHYLTHRKHHSKETAYCADKINSCLPDFRKILDGQAGHYSEFYYD